MAEIYNASQVLKLKARVTYVGALVNIFLAIIKVVVGILGQSAALIADGIHSLSDLVSDLFVIIAIKMGSREADHDHPYGHRRFETMATVLLGLGLIIVAGGIAWDALERLNEPEKLLIPNQDTMGIAIVSILANEWLFHYTKRVGDLTRSKLLLANAWHHRSDAFSSIVVLIGIAAVFLGYPFADAIAAVIVAVMIMKMGLSLVMESINELVDSALPEDYVREIRRVIKQTHDVQSIHFLRTRRMGEDAYIDAHIVVDSRISVSEGHMIGDRVRDELKTEFDDVVDVLVHIDPEDDEFGGKNQQSLTRKQVQVYLEHYLSEFIHSVDEFRIHYLDGLVEVEVILPHGMFTHTEQIEGLKKQCMLIEKEIDRIAKVYVFFKA
ncbi:MAG: cation transporter [Methylococcales symbiont of Hymedesmia sp. n. MRB-2018]|nr:MAG: cation transporter [Methylococcales symbiont of Hymedesmia sp. n. MRB-2018]KAF3983488.1 MAG: cation transporter [Methylococcales symbiont of Hymedesmia sp. n. MRB-2018]